MAQLITTADGNLTGATTFATVENGTNALKDIRNSSGSLITNQTSDAFTITNGSVIDAVMLWLQNASTTPTGTFKVDLQKGGVSQQSLTVNTADLPQGGPTTWLQPVLFKLPSTVTGDGSGTYTLVLTVTGTGVLYQKYTSTNSNITRSLRTTTTATPAAGDNLYICGELTGAGTKNTRTVTMNSTAATDYGSGVVNTTSVAGGTFAVSNWGTLTFGNSAATNYLLRLSADLIIGQTGTVNEGSSGAEIPRDSTAIVEFDCAADLDFGVQVLDGTFNSAGLEWTSGKAVVKCKLTANITTVNRLTGQSLSAATYNTTSAVGADGLLGGLSLANSGLIDSAVNTQHFSLFTGGSAIAGSTIISGTAWLGRGTGANNRYVRMLLGDGTTHAGLTSSVYADIDLQAGTIAATGTTGTGSYTSSSIVAVKDGYVVRLTGFVSTASHTPRLFLYSASGVGTVTYSGGATSCFNWDHVALVPSTLSDTTLSVDTDTGWPANAVVCVASTSQTSNDCETLVLNANAGSSSMVSSLYPWGFFGSGIVHPGSTHGGTSPVQAEVGLLSRNVKIRSTSPIFMTYFYATPAAVVNCSWTEFYFLGTNTTNRNGIEWDTHISAVSVGAKSLSYCSIHSGEANGVTWDFNGGAATGYSISNCVFWNLGSRAIAMVSALTTATETGWSITDNLMMKMGSHGLTLMSYEGTFTGNTVVGWASANYAFNMSLPTTVTQRIGTFSGNTAHSGLGHGLGVACSTLSGIVEDFTAYRCAQNGILFNNPANTVDLYLKNITLFGNGGVGSSGIGLTGASVLNIIGDNNIICGDSSFATGNAISLTNSEVNFTFNVQNLDTSGGTGIFVACTTADIANGAGLITGLFNNCKFGAPSLVTKTNWSVDSFIAFQKFNQTASDHRVETRYGQIRTDSSIYNVGAPSMRVTPSNASSKAVSAPKGRGILAAIDNGGTVTISVDVRKSQGGDGGAYNGNQPRLIQRANPALGLNDDVVLDTMSVAVGNWETLSATSSAASGDDGALEFYVDCDGTVGWINVDNWAAA